MGRVKIPRHLDRPGLDLAPDEMRALVEAATERVVEHLAGLDRAPLTGTRGAAKLAPRLREALPERGAPAERLYRQLFGRVLPASLNTASPGYLGYIPGGGLFPAAVAEFVAAATNRYVGLWQAAPLLVELEANVLRWFAAMLGFPPGAAGILTSGGSLANFAAVVAARTDRLPRRFQRGVVYASVETHHSVTKAARLAGLLPERMRAVRLDRGGRLDVAALRRAVTRDRARGLRPFLVVANAGTTATGAVDDLRAIADVASEERLFFHVDAAYGGFFALTERGRAALAGIERADAVTLDPHKGLFLPYGTGALVVRDVGLLRRAFAADADYLPPRPEAAERFDFCDLSPELSRSARGLRVWFPLKLHGAAAFRAALDEKLDLARDAAHALGRLPGVRVERPPELSLFTFRHVPPGMPPRGEAVDAHNRRLLGRINARGNVFLTGVIARGRFVLRVCVLSFRTHADRIARLVEDVAGAIA